MYPLASTLVQGTEVCADQTGPHLSKLQSRTSRRESSENTATEHAVATKTRSEQSDRLTEQKTDEDIKMTEWKNQNRPSIDNRLGGSIRPSVRSTSFAARLRDVKSREELARLELQRAEAAVNLARITLEKRRLEDKADDLNEVEDRISQVQNCFQASTLDLDETEHSIPEQDLQENEEIMKTEQPMKSTIQVQTLAGVIRQASDNCTATVVLPPSANNQLINQELPYYDGSSSEWVAFKIVYDDTSKAFTTTQNIGKLRRAIKRAARNTFKSVLHPGTTPLVRCVRSLRTIGYEERAPQPKMDLKVLKFRWYDYGVADEDKMREQLDRESTYTAKEEDEGGGVLKIPGSCGVGTVAISEDWCYARGGDCWRLV